jgi:hypothetical protein
LGLIKEIKYCLEAIGRRLRVYLNRKATKHRREKRASLIEKYIPKFVKSVYNIASKGDSKLVRNIGEGDLQNLMREAIGKKAVPSLQETPLIKEAPAERSETLEEKARVPRIKESDTISEKTAISREDLTKADLDQWTVKKLRNFCKEYNIEIPSKMKKVDLIQVIQENLHEKKESIEISEEKKEPKPDKVSITEPELKQVSKEPAKAVLSTKKGPKKKISETKITYAKPKSVQTQLPIITTESIIEALTNEWQTIKHLIFKLRIKDMMDARFLQIKLKELERKNKVNVDIKKGKKHWKLK